MRQLKAMGERALGWLFAGSIVMGCVGCAVWFFVWAWRGAISAIVGA